MKEAENNKLIAEFMGAFFDDKGMTLICGRFGLERVSSFNLKYHTSWDWLTPVVEKIEGFGIVAFEKNLQEEGDYQCLFTKGYDILICHYADTSLEATYKAVVEYINQINE